MYHSPLEEGSEQTGKESLLCRKRATDSSNIVPFEGKLQFRQVGDDKYEVLLSTTCAKVQDESLRPPSALFLRSYFPGENVIEYPIRCYIRAFIFNNLKSRKEKLEYRLRDLPSRTSWKMLLLF